MRKVWLFIPAVLVGLSLCSVGNASIIHVTAADDGDGAVVCTNNMFDAETDSLTLVGNQYWSPGHILGAITTDSAEDPTLTLQTAIDNDTAFAWTAFHVNVYMTNTFSISAATVYTPGDWTASITAPSWNGTEYQGSVDYYAGTPVGVGGTLDFSYKITFSGLTSYTFCQEMIAVPEPGTLGLALMGGLLLVRLTMGRGRRQG
jgi:hypothetical protein